MDTVPYCGIKMYMNANIGIVIFHFENASYFLSFLTISYSNRNLCPLQILSYTLEISQSIMKLLWPEFLITRTF